MLDAFTFPPEGSISLSDPKVRQIMYDIHGGIDFWTRAPLDFDAMHLDHVLPRALGGPDNVYNLVPTSSKINSQKNAKIDEIAITAVLGIIRTIYGPKALTLISKISKNAKSTQPNSQTKSRETTITPKRESINCTRSEFLKSSNRNSIYCRVMRPMSVAQIELLEMLRNTFKNASSTSLAQAEEDIKIVFEKGHPEIELYRKTIEGALSSTFNLEKLRSYDKGYTQTITNLIRPIKCKTSSDGKTESLSLSVDAAIANFLRNANFSSACSFYESGELTIS